MQTNAPRPLYLEEYPSFGDFDREALRLLAATIAASCKRIVEVGSWLGTGSTRVLIEQLSDGRGTLTCVDTWQGSPNVARHRELIKSYDVYATFLHNVANAGGSDFVTPWRMSSRDAALRVPDGSLDMVFLDGNHSYGATTEDIKAWLPKLGRGGILCGHDCETRVNDTNRGQLLLHRDADSVSGDDKFVAFHPGVILAVDECFAGRAHLWAEEILTLADGTRGAATIWDIEL